MTAKNCILTQKEVKRLFSYDPETGIVKRLITVSNNAKKNDIVGCKTKEIESRIYLVTMVNYKLYMLHRLIWLYMTGLFPEEYIDHIDHDGTNNKWINLRPASNQENQRNSTLGINNKSGITGVYFAKSKNLWVASIKINHKEKHLKTSKDFFECCCARKSAERRYNFHPNHGLLKQ